MSGAREVVLRSDVLAVVLLPEVGARIHRIRAFGEDLLRTPADRAAHRDEPFFWGAYHMAPWCNRAVAGASTIAGRTVQLDANFADGSAIHGLVSSSPWEERDDGSLAIRIGGHEGGWPWPHEVSLAPAVDAETLTLDYRVRNLSDAPMPAGVGFHPWFRRPVELRLPAASVYASNNGSSGEPRPVDGPLDLRRRTMPAHGIDATWTDLRPARVDLWWPEVELSARIEIESDAEAACVAVAAPDSIDAVAVEPQTHGPDPMRRLAYGEPDAPRLLPPGDDLRFRVRLSVAQGAV